MRSLIAILALIAATVAVQEPGIPVVVQTMMRLGPPDSAGLRAAFEAGLTADSLVRVVPAAMTREASSQGRSEIVRYMISINVVPLRGSLQIRLRSVAVATATVGIIDTASLPLGPGRDSAARAAGRRFAARLAGKAP